MTYISSILTVLLSVYHFQRSERGIHSLLLASNFLHADALDRAPGSHVPRAIPSLSRQLILFASFLARILVTLQYLLFGAHRIVFDIRCLFFFPPKMFISLFHLFCLRECPQRTPIPNLNTQFEHLH